MAKHAILGKAIPLVFAVALAMLVLPLVVPRAAYAYPIEFKDGNSFTFINAEDDKAWFFTKGSDEIASATSSNEAVAVVASIENGILLIEPVSTGKATISVTGADGSTTSVEIEILDKYWTNCLKDSILITNFWYGSKEIEIDAQPGAKCVLKIGKEKHSFKLNKTGSATVKLKKIYKLGTKFTCKFTKGKYSTTYKSKVYNGSGFDSVQGKKKSVNVSCWQLHKGDVVKVTYKGKTYSKKITKNKAYYTVKVPIKKKVTKNAKMKIVIKNKFKQKLYSESIQLKNWWYEMPEGDDLIDDEDTN